MNLPFPGARSRLLALGAMLAGLVLVVPASAGADMIVTASCEVPHTGFAMTAATLVRSDGLSYVLSDTRYRLYGSFRSEPRRRGHRKRRRYGYSNLNVVITSAGRVVFADSSPDALVADGREYVVAHRTPVSAALVTKLRFEAIFDVQWGGDPRCIAETEQLPLIAAPPAGGAGLGAFLHRLLPPRAA